MQELGHIACKPKGKNRGKRVKNPTVNFWGLG